MSDGRRTYRSALRAEQAGRTRAAVLDAAGTCFARDGYSGTTMKAIAAQAGVSLQTVFAQGSKAALLLAAVDRAVAGDAAAEAVLERADLQPLLASTDKSAKLAMLRDATVAYTRSAGPMVRAFRDAAAADPELAAHWAEYERRRYTDMRALIGSFAPLLREGVDVERATDVTWSVFTSETADNLHHGRDWSVEEYADWLVDAIDRLVLR
jgi:AcrR family transcriptional regulator